MGAMTNMVLAPRQTLPQGPGEKNEGMARQRAAADSNGLQ